MDLWQLGGRVGWYPDCIGSFSDSVDLVSVAPLEFR